MNNSTMLGSTKGNLSVREIEEKDIDSIIHYFLDSEPDFLVGMGVDLAKLPERNMFRAMLMEQLSQTMEQKQSYCIIWQVNNEPVGHSNVNKIIYGEEAFMHLHLWNSGVRKKGLGSSMVKLTLPYFFENLKLKKLYCEPYALNPAPNNVLKKIGFTFVKEYTTTPGWINFEQTVNRWELTHKQSKIVNPKS